MSSSSTPLPGILQPDFCMGFPGGSDGEESACNAGDLGLIPESGRSLEEGNGNPLQYSCLEIPWTEDPGGLQSMSLQRDITERLTLSFSHTDKKQEFDIM